MFSTKDYTVMTSDELTSEEKKLSSLKIPVALLAGLFVGFSIWSATHKGGATTFVLLAFVWLIGSIYTKKQKAIQAEISRRDTDSK